MSHYSTELFAKERIATWQREAGSERLTRPRIEPKATTPAASPRAEPKLSHRLMGWLAPVRRLVARHTSAA